MSRRRRSLLLLALVLGLVLASVVAIAVRPVVLGLDLRGGVQVILQGKPTADSQVTPQSIQRSVDIINNRVNAFGVSSPSIQTLGTDQISVQLPGVKNPDEVVTNLIKPAQLAFYDYENNVVTTTPSTSLYDTVLQAQKTHVDDPTQGAETLYAFDKTTHQNTAGPEPVTVGETTAQATQALRDTVEGAGLNWSDQIVESVPKGLTIVSQQETLATRQNQGISTYQIFQDRPALTGADISSASVLANFGNGGTGQPVVTMNFTGTGATDFENVTRTLAERGRIVQSNQSFAIVLDGQLISNPIVDYTQYPTGIDASNGAQIQGNFSQSSAQTLADQINSGALPIRLVPISESQVSATLGAQSLREALIAGITGLALVLIFLIAYYRLLGVVAALGLLIYAALFYAVVVLWPITLTLPGIAGVILTIGISADANVVIFERVREEARSGKSPAAALAAGYRRGIAAIIDANVVTLATAIIVFMFATEGPKGFAFTLGVGVLISLFTAVVATRAIFGVLLDSKIIREDRLMALKQGRVFKFDWVGHWRWWVAISTIPVGIGLIWLSIFGLNLGLDFTSGTRISTTLERPASEASVSQTVSAAGFPGATVQTFTQTVRGQKVDGIQIETKSLDPQQIRTLREALDAKYGVNTSTFNLDEVGPTFGREVIQNAIYAIILSFIIVLIYLIIRFEYRLALPAMLSVVHDVALSLGVYAITGRVVTSDTVAALLTILGYSLYDVVIVFDRIRENVPLMRGSRYRNIVNRSINETITRSVITSLTTLIPVSCLFIFGGPTLQDFSFALLVGILSGGVSSIVIAAPLASWWKERQPEHRKQESKRAKRRQVEDRDADVVDVAVLERAERGVMALPDPYNEVATRPLTTATETVEAAPEPEPESIVESVEAELLDAPPPRAPESPADEAAAAPEDTEPQEQPAQAAPPERPQRERRHHRAQQRRRRT
jgi:SecD/SecF fusion protein